VTKVSSELTHHSASADKSELTCLIREKKKEKIGKRALRGKALMVKNKRKEEIVKGKGQRTEVRGQRSVISDQGRVQMLKRRGQKAMTNDQ
jgi:hypothetical protein